MEIIQLVELPKYVNVSRRTVQYYDREGIIQPSKISEGGRRIYSNEDLQKFKLVILYKNLRLCVKRNKRCFMLRKQI